MQLLPIWGGYDLKDDRVKSLGYVCLCGNSAKDVVKEVAIKVSTKLVEQAIKNISSFQFAKMTIPYMPIDSIGLSSV